ncbi:MAG: flavin reductase family protein [Micropruina sp.]|uniref:flavin reductase family protein n=1 Tax=Micropruina sp. TaxID=2737536 RepID=UPI0039E6BA8E
MSAQPIAATEPGIDAEQFRTIFRGHPAGVAVITLHDGNRAYGFTATSVISVSAEPPLFAFSVHAASSSWSALSRVRRVMINFLAEDQADVAARFATSGIDRFAAGGWHPLPTGEPVLAGCAGWIEGRVRSHVPAAGSRLILAEAAAAWGTDRRPLIYRDRTYHRLDAPTS